MCVIVINTSCDCGSALWINMSCHGLAKYWQKKQGGGKKYCICLQFGFLLWKNKQIRFLPRYSECITYNTTQCTSFWMDLFWISSQISVICLFGFKSMRYLEKKKNLVTHQATSLTCSSIYFLDGQTDMRTDINWENNDHLIGRAWWVISVNWQKKML